MTPRAYTAAAFRKWNVKTSLILWQSTNKGQVLINKLCFFGWCTYRVFSNCDFLGHNILFRTKHNRWVIRAFKKNSKPLGKPLKSKGNAAVWKTLDWTFFSPPLWFDLLTKAEIEKKLRHLIKDCGSRKKVMTFWHWDEVAIRLYTHQMQLAAAKVEGKRSIFQCLKISHAQLTAALIWLAALSLKHCGRKKMNWRSHMLKNTTCKPHLCRYFSCRM